MTRLSTFASPRTRAAIPAFLIAVCAILLIGCAERSINRLDAPWWTSGESSEEQPVKLRRGVVRKSLYITMRDGVRIATDYYLPADLEPGERIPTILTQTRYLRALDMRWPFSALFPSPRELTFFVEHGYAIVRTDVRGSGASFGVWPSPWSRDMVQDSGEIVDWIISQPWSDGNVGAAGGSYEGTCAEMLLINQHEAVKAVAIMYALYDVYPDVAFPGGILLEWFTRAWERGNVAMDTNRLGSVAWYASIFTSGVKPVDMDRDRNLLRQAVSEHGSNMRVHQASQGITFRDDCKPGGMCIDEFSPHAYVEQISGSGAAIYSFSGWFDGGYSHSAIKRFMTVNGPMDRMTIGPWDHGGDDMVRQFSGPRKAKFDQLEELLRFFDYHLKGIDTGIYDEPAVHYYTMGEDEWKTSATWPLPGAIDKPLYMAEAGTLTFDEPEWPGRDSYVVDQKAGTGRKTRWVSLAMEVGVEYPDRREQDKRLLVYQTAPLSEDVEVTGHPMVTLYVSSTADDGEFFVYLEDVDRKGRVGYVTEGELRALHRRLSDADPPYKTPVPYRTFKRDDAMPLVPGEVAELTFDLLPVSYLFRKGHSIRVAIAGADADMFVVLPGGPPTIELFRGPGTPSRIVLPVMPASEHLQVSPR